MSKADLICTNCLRADRAARVDKDGGDASDFGIMIGKDFAAAHLIAFGTRRLSLATTASAHGGADMAEYRAYLIGSDGHFYEAFHLICADDAEAIEKAKQLVNGHHVEPWQYDRR